MNLEEFVCQFIRAAAFDSMSKFPLNWFGTYNALSLYCGHSHYSPFMPLDKYMTYREREENITKLINRGIPNLPFGS